MIVDLDDLLKYKNQKLLSRYIKDYPNNTLNAEDALEELLKYFWLVWKHKSEVKQFPDNEALKFECVMHYEMREIDDMWHTFLLFTRDYMDFCQYYFKKFIHHYPFPDDIDIKEDEYRLDLSRYLSYIYDNLGEQSVIKWFEWEQ